ncbi:MAG TPA: hypothetical protein VFX70_13430 [Mycobacteriales bacterium]|nr:hypothetical protein [Mycobacteriales bacterium]
MGRRFRVRGDAAVVGEVRRLLDHFAPANPADPADPPADTVAVVSVRRSASGYAVTGTGPGGGVGVGDGTARDTAGATALVLAGLNATALAGAGCLAVHAGVVARGGRAVAFPAGSGQGKSTLTAACLRAGLDYVSDEALCLGWPDAGVLPYPRPLELSGWSRAAVGLVPVSIPAPDDHRDGGRGDALVTAAELGAGLAGPPLVLDHVVLPCRHADPARTDVALDAAPRQRAAAALLTRSFNHWRDPDRAFDLVHEVVSRTRVWRLNWGDPTRAATVLSDLLPAR